MTGAKIGLRANGGKDRANRNLRVALVTGWYGAATTELPRQRGRLKPTWALEKAQSGAVSRSIAMSRGQTPRPRHDGPLRTGGGLAQTKRRGGCRVDSCGHAATGEPPGVHEVSEPWRVALQAGPGTFSGRADEAQRWQARRAETVLAATVGRPTRRSRRLGRQRKASKGTLAALLRLRPSRTARQRIAHHNLATPRPPRGRVTRTPGRGRLHRAPAERRREPGRGAIRHPTYAAQSFISTLRRSNRSLRR